MLSFLLLLFRSHVILLKVAFSSNLSLGIKRLRHNDMVIMAEVDFQRPGYRVVAVFDLVDGALAAGRCHPIAKEALDSDVLDFGFGFAFALVQVFDSVFEFTCEAVGDVYEAEAELLAEFE